MIETNRTCISMAWRRTVVSPVRQRWRCPSLELSYRYVQLGTNICSVLWWAAIVDSIVEMTIPGAASDGGNGGLAVLSCMCYGYSTHVILCTYVTSSLRTGDRRFHDFVVTGGTVGCDYDNLQCRRWRQGCQVDLFGTLYSSSDLFDIK